MPVRKIRKSGSSFVGSFPSLKLGRSVRFESTLESDYLYFLEYDPTVSTYEEQPFEILGMLDDGSPHKYTPDFKVIQNNYPSIVEIKPYKFLNHENTIRQMALGKKWACENGYDFRVVTDQEIRIGARLNNLKLMYRYSRLSDFPFELLQEVKKIIPYSGHHIQFSVAAELLMPANPARCKPYLWSLIYHRILDTDLDLPLSNNSLISLSVKGADYVKSQD